MNKVLEEQLHPCVGCVSLTGSYVKAWSPGRWYWEVVGTFKRWSPGVNLYVIRRVVLERIVESWHLSVSFSVSPTPTPAWDVSTCLGVSSSSDLLLLPEIQTDGAAWSWTWICRTRSQNKLLFTSTVACIRHFGTVTETCLIHQGNLIHSTWDFAICLVLTYVLQIQWRVKRAWTLP